MRSYQSAGHIFAPTKPSGAVNKAALGAQPASVAGLLEQILENTIQDRFLYDLIKNTEQRLAQEAMAKLTKAERAFIPRALPGLLSRLFPWISAAGLAAMLLSVAFRASAPKQIKPGSQGGPAPDDPEYVPPGWRLHTERDPPTPSQWDTWSDPPSRQDDAFYPTTNDWPLLSSDPALRKQWDEGSQGSGSLRFRMKQIGGNTNFHIAHDRWEKDAEAVGTGVSRPGLDLAPQPMQLPHVEVIPTVAPDILPPLSTQPRILPVPKRALQRFNRLAEIGIVTTREVGPRPETAPAPSPVTQPNPKTETVMQGSGGGGGTTYTRGSTHKFEPPPKKVREVKLKAHLTGLVRTLVNAATETADAVLALHKALPKSCRRARTWKDKNGKWHRARVDSMLRDIAQCGSHMDFNAAVRNLIVNAVQDFLIGIVNGTVNRASGALGVRSGQGAATKIGKSTDGSDGHWSDVPVKALESLLTQLAPSNMGQPPIFGDRRTPPKLVNPRPRFPKQLRR